MSTTQRRSLKRAAAGVSAGMLTLTGFAAIATPATAQSNFSLTRESGADRYGTAAKIATDTFGTADNVLIASGEAGHFADALAGNFLAGSKGAPVLLTAAGSLPKATSDALATLKAKNVTILGGTSAVSAAVENALKANYTVTRIGGANRYATGAAVAAAGGTIGQTEGKGATAFLASGLNFADALVAGGPAYAGKLPVEVTDSNTLSPETSASLTSLSIKNVVIVGGTSAVSQKVQDAVVAKGITVTRLAGTSRQGTAVAVANYATGTASGLGFSKALVDLATGADFADALAGGPSAGKDKAPLLLTVNAGTLGADTQAYLSTNSGTLTGGRVFGGTSAVSDAAVAAAQTAGRGTTQASLTVRPELRSAAITGTVTPAQSNGSNVVGTTVSYTFDESVLSAAQGNFKLYRASDASAIVADDLVSVSGNTVTVRFRTLSGTTDTNGAANSAGTPTQNASNYTLATVIPGAAIDASGLNNPAGAAGVGASSTTTPSTAVANTTTAPDLRSVAGFRTSGTTQTAVDFTFDQNAFAANNDGSGFRLITSDGSVISCFGPFGPTSVTANGGSIAGGNGTTTITTQCNNPGGSLITAGQISRAYVAQNAVQDAAQTPAAPGVLSRNPLESVSVSNNGQTTTPDLTSAQFIPANTGTNATNNDQVLYTFDQAVTTPVFGNFHVFRANAAQLNGSAIDGINTAGTQVLVQYTAGSLTNAVGASADTAATTTSLPASVGVTPVQGSATTTTPGQIAAPELTSVALSSSSDAFGATTESATYTFDKAFGAPVFTNIATSAQRFRLYKADGTVYAATSCTVPSNAGTSNTVVTCTAFQPVNGLGAPTGTNATTADVASSTLGTVDAGAVTGTGTVNNHANPEGATATSGGTGTPTA